MRNLSGTRIAPFEGKTKQNKKLKGIHLKEKTLANNSALKCG